MNLISKKKLTIDIVWNITANIVIKFRGLVIAPVISYFCGIEWYGSWVLMYSISSYALAFSTLLLPHASVRFFSEEEEDKKEEIFILCLVSIFIYSSILSILMAGNANLLSEVLLKDVGFSNLLVLGSLLIILFSWQQMITSYFRARDNIKISSSIEALFSILELFCISLTIWLTRDLILALSIFLILGFMLEIALAIKVIKFSAITSIFSKDVRLRYRRYLEYSLPLLPSSITELFAVNGDRFIIGYFLGSKLVGIYSIAYAFSSSLTIFSGPIVYSLLPKVSTLWTEGHIKEVRAIIGKGTKFFVIAGAVFFAINLLLGNQILVALAGHNSGILENNGLLVSLSVTVGILFYGLLRIRTLYILLLNETQKISITYIAICLLNLILNIIFIPQIGILGAGIATLVTYLIGVIVVNYLIKQLFPKEQVKENI